MKTALQVVHWMRQMVSPPRRTRAAAGLVEELKAKREEKREDELDKRLGITQELKVSHLILKIDSDGAVLTGRFGGLSHVSPSVEIVVGADETSCG